MRMTLRLFKDDMTDRSWEEICRHLNFLTPAYKIEEIEIAFEEKDAFCTTKTGLDFKNPEIARTLESRINDGFSNVTSYHIDHQTNAMQVLLQPIEVQVEIDGEYYRVLILVYNSKGNKISETTRLIDSEEELIEFLSYL